MVRMETGHRRTESHCDLTYHTRRWHWGAHTPHRILPNTQVFITRVVEIWLLHLSDGNSNSERFKREVKEISGKPVYID